MDGTIIIERTDENERFYGERISVTDILAGKAKRPPRSIQTLIQTIKAAQGDSDVEESWIPPPGQTPGDVEVQPATLFGVPDPDDPDPFGVKALEAEGLFIREAGTRSRPSYDVFEFKPSPHSPIYSTFRRSLDSSPRSSWRASVQSHASVDRGTQTDVASFTAPTSISRASSRSTRADRIDRSPWDAEDGWDTVIPERPAHLTQHREYDSDQDSVDDDYEVHEVSSATVSKRESTTPSSPVSIEDTTAPPELKRHSPTFTRARLVTIPKRLPPALPPRNPHRDPVPMSQSTPTSPTSSTSSSLNGRRSVASHPDNSTVNGFAQLPLHPNNYSSSSLLSKETPQSHNHVSAEKDEFHSVTSAQASDDDEAEPDTATVNGFHRESSNEDIISDSAQSEHAALPAAEAVANTATQEPASKPESNDATFEETKSVAESGSHRTSEPAQPA